MLKLSGLEEYNNCETYVHGSHGSHLPELKAHAREVDKVELVGRDSAGEDWAWLDYGQGVIYALPFADRDNATEYAGNHGVVFVLGIIDQWTSTEADYEYSKGEALCQLDSYQVIAVIDEDDNVFEPMQWANQ